MYRVVFEVRSFDEDDSCYEGDPYVIGKYLLDFKMSLKEHLESIGLSHIEIRGPKIRKVEEGMKYDALQKK